MSKAVGAQLERARLAEGLSQTELTVKLDVSQAAVSTWEVGTIDHPPDQLKKPERVLGRIRKPKKSKEPEERQGLAGRRAVTARASMKAKRFGGVAVMLSIVAACASYSSIMDSAPDHTELFKADRKQVRDCALEDLRMKHPQWYYSESEQPRDGSSRVTAWFATLIGTQGPSVGWDVRFLSRNDGEVAVEIRSSKSMWGNSMAPTDVWDIIRSCAAEFSGA